MPSSWVLFTDFSRRVRLSDPLMWYSTLCSGRWEFSNSFKITSCCVHISEGSLHPNHIKHKFSHLQVRFLATQMVFVLVCECLSSTHIERMYILLVALTALKPRAIRRHRCEYSHRNYFLPKKYSLNENC